MMCLPTLTNRDMAVPSTVTVMASRLELIRLRTVPAFLLAALRLRRSFGAAPGAISLGLAAQPLHRTFWTISVWTDEQSLGAFNASALHQRVVTTFRPAMRGSTFSTWTADRDATPSWADAQERLTRRGASDTDDADVST